LMTHNLNSWYIHPVNQNWRECTSSQPPSLVCIDALHSTENHHPHYFFMQFFSQSHPWYLFYTSTFTNFVPPSFRLLFVSMSMEKAKYMASVCLELVIHAIVVANSDWFIAYVNQLHMKYFSCILVANIDFM